MPSFCARHAAEELSVTSLAQPVLAAVGAGHRQLFFRQQLLAGRVKAPDAESHRVLLVDLAEVVIQALDFSQLPSGSTIFHQARVVERGAHSTAFLPPAFMAMFPPMHEAEAEVGPWRRRGRPVPPPRDALGDDTGAGADGGVGMCGGSTQVLDRADIDPASRC